MSTVVLIQDVDKSNCHLMYKYLISKQIINTMNNFRPVKAVFAILCYEVQGSIPSKASAISSAIPLKKCLVSNVKIHQKLSVVTA